MALLAEELVEEWLNREGFFTIRGLKLGTAEMDLLAIKPSGKKMICRHVEVQASVNPISYICALPHEWRKKTGRGAHSAKRREEAEMTASVDDWIHKKFRQPRKVQARSALCQGTWSEELVVNVVRFPEELELIRAKGITIHRLPSIVQRLLAPTSGGYTASGADLVNLLLRPAVMPTLGPEHFKEVTESRGSAVPLGAPRRKS